MDDDERNTDEIVADALKRRWVHDAARIITDVMTTLIETTDTADEERLRKARDYVVL